MMDLSIKVRLNNFWEMEKEDIVTMGDIMMVIGRMIKGKEVGDFIQMKDSSMMVIGLMINNKDLVLAILIINNGILDNGIEDSQMDKEQWLIKMVLNRTEYSIMASILLMAIHINARKNLQYNKL